MCCEITLHCQSQSLVTGCDTAKREVSTGVFLQGRKLFLPLLHASLVNNGVQPHSKAPPWDRLYHGELWGPASHHAALLGETNSGIANGPA